MDSKASAPVLKHREWRFLLRDFSSAEPSLRRLDSRLLQLCLCPVASTAWWLLRFAKEVLEEAKRRGSLQLLLPGVSTETMDEGRWFAFLPWMLGMPDLKSHVYLVGDELLRSSNGLESSRGVSRRELEWQWKTPGGWLVQHLPAATIFNGLLSEWRSEGGNETRVDACVLFAPGFSQHFDTWFTETDLLPYLRAGTPTAVFSYSSMDMMEDVEVLGLSGIESAPADGVLNPWRLSHDMEEYVGSGAKLGWRLQCTAVPETVQVQSEAIQEFQALMEYTKSDFETMGGDRALERLGGRWEVRRADGAGDDAIIVLPREQGILESTSQLGFFDDRGFTPYEPAIVAPSSVLDGWPGAQGGMKRVLWAARVHRDWAGPALDQHEAEQEDEEDDGLLFGGLDPDSMREGMRALIKEATGKDYDPDDFMEQMREQGGIHGPTHQAWFDLLSTLQWGPKNWVDDPERYQPAFKLPMKTRKGSLPAICEAYAYMPDDDTDALAKRSMAAVQQLHPKGAVMFFKSIPYMKVDGHKYHFGGMLWWQGKWSPFAITRAMGSVDDIVDQIESGFRLGDAEQRFADDTCGITVGLNLMCNGLDPNEPRKMVGLKSGKWVTLMPD